MSQPSTAPSRETRETWIREVWAHNLDAEMETVRTLAEKYKFVAMDSEFPGVIARPVGSFASVAEYNYQTLRANVDLLRLIQLGITFADETGALADDVPTWQFNFRFSLEEDIFAADSIELLQQAGIDFAAHAEKGIDTECVGGRARTSASRPHVRVLSTPRAPSPAPRVFGELLMSSGLVLCDDIRWISFHAGYDFGYLLKLLTNAALPGA